MKKRNLIILRGVSGSGKTTFCNLIGGNTVVCCADDFFTDENGNYKWYAEGLGKAHKYCAEKFDDALYNDTIDTIIVANVNAKPSDWKYYVDKATKYGLKITYVVLENRHGNKDVHSVPFETLERQEKTIRENLKLR